MKAEMEGDSRHWSPLEALKALVRDIEAGEIVPDGCMGCIMWVKNKEGKGEFFQRWAGATHNEATSILSLAHYKSCKSWDGE